MYCHCCFFTLMNSDFDSQCELIQVWDNRGLKTLQHRQKNTEKPSLASGRHIWLLSCELFNDDAGGILSLSLTQLHTDAHKHTHTYANDTCVWTELSSSLLTGAPITSPFLCLPFPACSPLFTLTNYLCVCVWVNVSVTCCLLEGSNLIGSDTNIFSADTLDWITNATC